MSTSQKFTPGQTVWFKPPYFAYAFPGKIQIRAGELGIWINFFGDGQCFFKLNKKQKKYLIEAEEAANAFLKKEVDR